LNKNLTLGGVFVLLSFLLTVPYAQAQADLTFRQRNARMIIPRYEEAKPLITEDGPKLIFSDSPESVSACGIMYRDTVEGQVRVFFHHVNATQNEMKLALVLRNPSLEPIEVKIGNRGISQPRHDYFAAGKEAQKDYFASEGHLTTFKLLGYQELLSWHDGQVFKPRQLITGIVDLEVAKPVEVSVLMLSVKDKLTVALDNYHILPPDEGNVLRGTFPTSNCHVVLPELFNTQGNKIVEIKLADDLKNPFVRGIDATTGKKTFNNGNYGVIYDVHFNTGGKNETLVQFSPEGGLYAGYGKIGEEGQLKLVGLPEGETAFGKAGREEAIVVGTIPGGKKGEMIFSPPGSSNLPIKIILIPEKVLQKITK